MGRKVREEIGFYVPLNGFAHLEGFEGPDPEVLCGRAHAEFYLARHVPIDKMVVTDGALLIINSNELHQIASKLTPFARMALDSCIVRGARESFRPEVARLQILYNPQG